MQDTMEHTFKFSEKPRKNMVRYNNELLVIPGDLEIVIAPPEESDK